MNHTLVVLIVRVSRSGEPAPVSCHRPVKREVGCRNWVVDRGCWTDHIVISENDELLNPVGYAIERDVIQFVYKLHGPGKTVQREWNKARAWLYYELSKTSK